MTAWNESWINRYTLDDKQVASNYGLAAEPTRADDNLTYLQFIDLVAYIWGLGHPEILFKPYAANESYDPEKGYIIYSLEDRTTRQSSSKPRPMISADHPDKNDIKIQIFTQSFNNLVSFTAVHQNPRIAEEIIEIFEDFMASEAPPIFKRLGVEEFVYSHRTSDRNNVRFGTDVNSRTVVYLVTLQKVYLIDMPKTEDMVLHIRTQYWQSATPTIEQATPSISVTIYDTHSAT